MAKTRRRCEVCGAKVRSRHPKTTTCDSTCTAAKRARRTRIEQLHWDMEHPKHAKPFKTYEDDYCDECRLHKSQCACWDTLS